MERDYFIAFAYINRDFVAGSAGRRGQRSQVDQAGVGAGVVLSLPGNEGETDGVCGGRGGAEEMEVPGR